MGTALAERPAIRRSTCSSSLGLSQVSAWSSRLLPPDLTLGGPSGSPSKTLNVGVHFDPS